MTPVHPTAQQVLATYAANDRDLTFGRAELIAAQISASNGLNYAIAQLWHDVPGSQAYRDMLVYREALTELADRPRWIGRLKQEAADLWDRAQGQRALNAEYAGKAAWRANQGEAGLASDFKRIADAHNSVAARMEDESQAKAYRAMELEYGQQEAERLAEVAQPMLRVVGLGR